MRYINYILSIASIASIALFAYWINDSEKYARERENKQHVKPYLVYVYTSSGPSAHYYADSLKVYSESHVKVYDNGIGTDVYAESILWTKTK